MYSFRIIKGKGEKFCSLLGKDWVETYEEYVDINEGESKGFIQTYVNLHRAKSSLQTKHHIKTVK